jgi:hypothetical protein
VNVSYVEVAGGEHGFGTVARNQPQFDAALRSLIAAAPALPALPTPMLTATHTLLVALLLSCCALVSLRLRTSQRNVSRY